MFWLGLIVALVSGLVGIGLSREHTKKRFPRVGDMHFDLISIALLVFGLLISAIDYYGATEELNRIRISANEALAKHQPRSILPEQREKLVSCLRQSSRGKVVIHFGMFDGEAMSYGEQIESVLSNAGFEVAVPRLPDGNALIAVLNPGSHIVVRDTKNPPVHAVAIQRCLLDCGIRMEALFADDSNFDSNAVVIAIGQKQ